MHKEDRIDQTQTEMQKEDRIDQTEMQKEDRITQTHVFLPFFGRVLLCCLKINS